MQDGGRRKAWGILLALLAAVPAAAADTIIDPAARVGAVTALWAAPDGGFEEHRGNCLLWTTGGPTYTIADLHTVMAGADGTPDRVADRISVTIGAGSSRASLVWPPAGQRDARKTDMAILELEGGVAGKPFGLEVFQHRDGGLPNELYLSAPGHRPAVLRIGATAVAYGSQWFIYRELAHGDSGGMVFAVENGEIVPYGFVSATGSLPGESTRGTAVYGRDAIRIFINQFLRARASMTGG
jgi:hypothetical protein